jgi:hypothetical protein
VAGPLPRGLPPLEYLARSKSAGLLDFINQIHLPDDLILVKLCRPG